MEYLTITNILVGITCLISYAAFKDPHLKNKLIFYPALIKEHKEFHRFITAGFIHGSFIHLAFNMITFWSFGNNVEAVFKLIFGPISGMVFFIGLYFLAFIASHVPDYMRHQDNPSYRALGASGAVSAVLFANILFDPWSNLLIFFIPCPQIIAGLGFLWYSSYMDAQNSQDNIGHNAHYFGALFGLAFTIALHPAFFPNFMECTLTYNKECLIDYLITNGFLPQ